MWLAETGSGRGDATSLAMTLIRTFGSGALALVEAQVTASADHPDLQARWCEVRDALAVLGNANMHMSAALDLLDQIEEASVSPMLDHAIVRLGLRDVEGQIDGAGVTVTTCSRVFYEDKAQRHLAQAESCHNTDEKTAQLNAASYYATLGQSILDCSKSR